MPPIRRAILALFAILLALYGPPTYRTLQILGVIPQSLPPPLVSSINSSPGSSSGSGSSSGVAHGSASEVITIPNTRHCEDLHHHQKSGLLFTACEGATSPRFDWFPPLGHFDRPEDVLRDAERGQRGGLVVVDPKALRAKWLDLVGFEGPFVTHGIDIIDDPLDPRAIYIHAINHAPASHPPSRKSSPPSSSQAALAPEDLVSSRLEIFHHILGTHTATHIRTIHHPLIRTPNDVYSVAPGDLLVTNDHKYRAGFLRTVEDLVSHPLGPKSDVVRVQFTVDLGGAAGKAGEEGADGKERQESGEMERGVSATIVARGLHNPNGLGHGPDGEILLVDAAGGVLYFGSLTSHTNTPLSTTGISAVAAKLILNRSVSFPSTIDNPSSYTSTINPTKKGIINAGLTAAHTLSTSARDPSGVDPSIIYYLPHDSSTPQVIFRDDGRVLRSASAAVLVDDDKGETWCFGTGFISEGIVAMRVVL